MNKGNIAKAMSLALALGLLTSIGAVGAHAWDPQPTNPFPGVAYGAEIPGLSKTITCTDTPQIPDDCVRAGGGQVSCPAWTANDITPSLRPDGSWASLKSWCRNSWTPPTSAADDEDFRNRQTLAVAAATLQSQEYNAAHPGEQKCVTWGPIVHANGISTASGGVCANPVGLTPAGTTVQVAPSPVNAGSSGSTPAIESVTVSSSTPSSGESRTVNSAPAAPSVDLTQFGIGKPFTRVVSGRVNASGCPAGFQAAVNNLDGIQSQGASECWPADAWAAYSVGGTTWSNFKNANISSADQQAVVQSVELNRVKAIALNRAQQDANLNIGKTMCVQWAAGAQTGQECAYIPAQNPNLGPGSRVDTSTVSAITPSSSESATPVVVVIAIESVTANSQQNFGGTVAQVKQAVTSVVEDTATAKAINTLLQKVSNLASTTIKSSAKLPVNKALDVEVLSKSLSVCTVTSSKIVVKKTGTCKLQYSISDDDENTFVLDTKIKVKK